MDLHDGVTQKREDSMDRNLTMNLARVTEAAAVSSSLFLGRGDKNLADSAAVEAMRNFFDDMSINGIVVIGEGEMDEAPMLFIGERIGKEDLPESELLDIAVDPIDGTTNVAKGLGNSISVVAAAPHGSLLHAPDMYMDKMVAGPKAKDVIHMSLPLDINIRRLAKALDKEIAELTISMLDRPRHAHLVEEVRRTGARIKLFNEGDIAGALATCFDNNSVDMMIGSGGAPEGVIAAVGVKAMGGTFQGRLLPENEEQLRRCEEMGITDVNKVLELDDLVRSDDAIFAATGITDGDFLDGTVSLGPNRVQTTSIVLRVATGTVRHIIGIHDLKRKPEYAVKKDVLIEKYFKGLS